MILADAPTPSANTIWLSLNSLAAFGSCLAMIGMWVQNRRQQSREITPQPLQVEFAKRFVTKDFCDQVHNQSEGKINDLKMQVQKLSDDRTKQSGELHEKINGVAREVSELKASSELQSQSLAAVTTNINLILQRLPRFHRE